MKMHCLHFTHLCCARTERRSPYTRKPLHLLKPWKCASRVLISLPKCFSGLAVSGLSDYGKGQSFPLLFHGEVPLVFV